MKREGKRARERERERERGKKERKKVEGKVHNPRNTTEYEKKLWRDVKKSL